VGLELDGAAAVSAADPQAALGADGGGVGVGDDDGDLEAGTVGAWVDGFAALEEWTGELDAVAVDADGDWRAWVQPMTGAGDDGQRQHATIFGAYHGHDRAHHQLDAWIGIRD